MYKNLLLLLLGVAVSFFLGEIALRLMRVSYPSFYTWDTYIGPVLKPNTKGWWKKEGQAFIEINNDGLRDINHDLKKPPDVVRIAVLGDSYAEALQIPLEKTFWKVMESKLETGNVFAQRRVEVINFGVSGYGTGQELMTLRTRVWNYEPDIIVLAFLTGNDVRNNSKQLNGIDCIPYFTIEDGNLSLDTDYRNSRKYKFHQQKLTKVFEYLLNYSRVLQVLNEASNSFPAFLSRMKVGGAGHSRVIMSEAGLDNAVYEEPENKQWQDAWKVTEALLREMKKEIDRKKASFFVVTLTNGIQVHPDQKIRQGLMDTLHVENLDYPERRIKELGKKEGFEVINLVYPMLAYAQRTQTYLHGFNDSMGSGHWNEQGHALAGEILAQEIAVRVRHKSEKQGGL